MECTCLCYGSYIIIVYFPEYHSVKYLKARTVVFFFVFPIPRKMLAHYRKKSVCWEKKKNTQLVNFSASSVKGHWVGDRECLPWLKGTLDLVFPQPCGSYRKAWENLKEFGQRSSCYVPSPSVLFNLSLKSFRHFYTLCI